ncbi:hypothetical protein EG329_012736 [Mollisiaceae sp. DMI_Dod_QoI]|nr:hypothetical protein EG329_012736 [Helotiales sp. DMI_Dod_QoI]
MIHLLLKKGANIRNPEVYKIDLLQPESDDEGPGGFDLTRTYDIAGSSHCKLIESKTRVYLVNSMTNLLVGLGRYGKEQGPMTAPFTCTVAPYLTASEYCLDLWQRETQEGYDERLLESIVAAIKVFVVNEASIIRLKDWDQFPPEVRSKLALFTTPKHTLNTT